ncbi:unnamed protein product, partial [Tetraodon nigroviridis]
ASQERQQLCGRGLVQDCRTGWGQLQGPAELLCTPDAAGPRANTKQTHPAASERETTSGCSEADRPHQTEQDWREIVEKQLVSLSARVATSALCVTELSQRNGLHH